jgi:hypothetical protein
MMVMAGFRVLGPGALVNADLFESHAMPRSREGIYAVLGQPIYTGYGLIVFDRGVRRGHPMLAALGPWLSFLLVAVLAPAENCALRRSSSHDLEVHGRMAALEEPDHRSLVLWATDCVERVLTCHATD